MQRGRPAHQGLRWGRQDARKDRRATRAAAGASAARRLRVSRVRGALGGPGPRAPRARCVPRPARKARRAGAARLRAAFSPPPPAPRGFGRQGAGAGGTGVRGPPAGGNGADRCPGAGHWTESELRPARRLFVLAAGSAGPGGKSYRASGRPRRRCPLESGPGPLLEVRSDGPPEPPRGRREAGREMGRTGRRASERGSSSLGPGTFPGDDLRPPGTAVTYRELVGLGFLIAGLPWAWCLARL